MLGIAVSPNAREQFVGAHTRHTAPGRGDTAAFDERFQVCAKNEYACPGAAYAAEPNAGNLFVVEQAIERAAADGE